MPLPRLYYLMHIAVIIAAAGGSSRYQAAGGVRSKLDEDLGGKPLLQRTVEAFTKYEGDETIEAIIVAGPADDESFESFQERHADRLGLLGAKLVRGGATHRWESIAAALAACPPDCTHIAVHDAARPCVSQALLARLFRAAKAFPAVIPALPSADTVKRAIPSEQVVAIDDPAARLLGETPDQGKMHEVRETLDRTGLMLVQTPQVFHSRLLRRAYATLAPKLELHPATPAPPGASEPQRVTLDPARITDDAMLVEVLGERVMVVEGERRNLKVTLPEDLPVVRALMGFREPEGRPVQKRF